MYIVRVDAQFLAVAQYRTYVVTVHAIGMDTTTSISLKEIREYCTFLKWTKSGNVLAIGTSKGRLAMYEPGTNTTIRILDKHTKVSDVFVFIFH